MATPPKWADYAALFREPDAAWFCFFYSFTFGGFVGLASFPDHFFHDQYALSKVRAGDFTTIVVLAGSFLRPVGGWLSDKIGGYRLLMLLLAGVAGLPDGSRDAARSSTGSRAPVLTMGMLGMGNGAVFQLVPQRFSERVGVLTGLVGAAGGLGGFFLPFLLGAIKQRTGQYSGGLFLFAAAFFLAALILLQLGTRWRASWQESAVERAGIFSYRDLAESPARRTCRVKRQGESQLLFQRGTAMAQRLVVIGNGMAGVACVEQILKHVPKFEITIFGDETHVNYNRILLSSVLAGEKAAEDIVLNGLDWYEKQGIELRLGVRITDVDSECKTVTGDDGSVTSFDKLLLATGSTPLIPPIEGVKKEGVFVFRNLGRHAGSTQSRRTRKEGRCHRWRSAGARSRARSASTGLRSHRHPSDGHAHGTAVRFRRWRLSKSENGVPRSEGATGAQYCRHSRER